MGYNFSFLQKITALLYFEKIENLKTDIYVFIMKFCSFKYFILFLILF